MAGRCRLSHLRYFLKGWDEVVVTDDGQGIEHVDGLKAQLGPDERVQVHVHRLPFHTIK